ALRQARSDQAVCDATWHFPRVHPPHEAAMRHRSSAYPATFGMPALAAQLDRLALLLAVLAAVLPVRAAPWARGTRMPGARIWLFPPYRTPVVALRLERLEISDERVDANPTNAPPAAVRRDLACRRRTGTRSARTRSERHIGPRGHREPARNPFGGDHA